MENWEIYAMWEEYYKEQRQKYALSGIIVAMIFFVIASIIPIGVLLGMYLSTILN